MAVSVRSPAAIVQLAFPQPSSETPTMSITMMMTMTTVPQFYRRPGKLARAFRTKPVSFYCRSIVLMCAIGRRDTRVINEDSELRLFLIKREYLECLRCRDWSRASKYRTSLSRVATGKRVLCENLFLASTLAYDPLTGRPFDSHRQKSFARLSLRPFRCVYVHKVRLFVRRTPALCN